MKARRGFLFGLGALLALAVAFGLAFASDASPLEEPPSSPYFDATLQQAVNQLDGKEQPAAAGRIAQGEPTHHYTTDVTVWPECEFGYTLDLVAWPFCHYTTDPGNPDCGTPWPTQDYTWDTTMPDCENHTTDPVQWPWCDPFWTTDPAMWPQCRPLYTKDPGSWPWCNPRFTRDPAQWPGYCEPGSYTYVPGIPGCQYELTLDPYIWPECHFTSDPWNQDCAAPYPTQDYTSNPLLWPECDPLYTSDPGIWPWCSEPLYTQDPMWPWCMDPLYTAEPVWWPRCHFTSDPQTWPECGVPYATKDYTWDTFLWPECDNHTSDPVQWPWCDPLTWTIDPLKWPLCNPAWTWDPTQWPACEPGYTNDPDIWPECSGGPYTYATTWPECQYYTADARIWRECHYTSDPNLPECNGVPFPTKDYTTDTVIWPECHADPGYTSDPQFWPECHYTSDPVAWPECEPQPELGDLGDAPDSTNHAGVNMTAYPAGGPPGTTANFPSVYDPATGLPQGPKHWLPRADAWLGPWVTLENDADLMPDEDSVTNIDPSVDLPDQDWADDGLLFPVVNPHCVSTVISYTVTITPGASARSHYVNVWFDWIRDGDWDDVPLCPDGSLAPEWAVQNQVLPALPPGTYVFQTPAYLPFNPTPDDPIWMRISIAEMPAPLIPGSPLADGRGPANGYQYGETEDYYLEPEPDPDYDIYLKDNDTDDGSVPSSSPWWRSPDIWVRNDGDCTNTTHENPTPGSTTTVCVRVRNRMATTVTNITVDVYYANAALALSWPGSWSYIGSFGIASLAGGATTVQSVSWSVPFITGHFCLRAHADSLQDPLWTGPDTIVPVTEHKNNNNIAQKNTNIVDYPEVTACGFYTTTVYTDVVYFDAVNTWATTKTVNIVFDSTDFPLGTGTLMVEPGTLWMRWNVLTNFNQSGTTLLATGLPATMGDIAMSPSETARMTMTIAAEIDERFIIDVIEQEYPSGTELGGIEYVRDLPNCIYLPIVLRDSSP